ncbi:hypothetical protein V1498_11820 [Peribacillus sp. SCS-26]|uniref:hypothetical protein n=1 Tax=Paraperibacillus marinus TaxID=3115295 RepID=UPI0039063F23
MKVLRAVGAIVFAFAIVGIVTMIIDISTDPPDKPEPTVEAKAPAKEETPKKEELAKVQVKDEEKPAPKPAAPQKTEITFAEFDTKFERDPDMESYPKGVFQLSDGSKVNADYIQYREGGYFDYASAIFFEGKLASLQLETEATLGDVKAGLGVDLTNAVVEERPIGYEITFDDRFAESNIAIYPNEWE